jgi:ABC-type polysaccharide/polyol phosphate export permease
LSQGQDNTREIIVLGAKHSLSWRPAWLDIMTAVTARDLWQAFAWNDVMARYRRSSLGQFWITLSIAIFVLAIGVFYGQILGVPLYNYLPYLAVGYILWSFLSSVTAEGSTVFVSGASFLTQLRIPQTGLVLRCVQRNVIIFAHNASVIVVVLLIFPHSVGLSLVGLIPAAILWYVTACWVVMLLGLVSVRFRDISQIVASFMQIAFFVTPVLYQPDMLTGRARLLADLNPFAHYIALVREPLLGRAPATLSWIVCSSITIGGALITFMIFTRLRSRVPYWL